MGNGFAEFLTGASQGYSEGLADQQRLEAVRELKRHRRQQETRGKIVKEAGKESGFPQDTSEDKDRSWLGRVGDAAQKFVARLTGAQTPDDSPPVDPTAYKPPGTRGLTPQEKAGYGDTSGGQAPTPAVATRTGSMDLTTQDVRGPVTGTSGGSGGAPPPAAGGDVQGSGGGQAPTAGAGGAPPGETYWQRQKRLFGPMEGGPMREPGRGSPSAFGFRKDTPPPAPRPDPTKPSPEAEAVVRPAVEATKPPGAAPRRAAAPAKPPMPTAGQSPTSRPDTPTARTTPPPVPEPGPPLTTPPAGDPGSIAGDAVGQVTARNAPSSVAGRTVGDMSARTARPAVEPTTPSASPTEREPWDTRQARELGRGLDPREPIPLSEDADQLKPGGKPGEETQRPETGLPGGSQRRTIYRKTPTRDDTRDEPLPGEAGTTRSTYGTEPSPTAVPDAASAPSAGATMPPPQPTEPTPGAVTPTTPSPTGPYPPPPRPPGPQSSLEGGTTLTMPPVGAPTAGTAPPGTGGPQGSSGGTPPPGQQPSQLPKVTGPGPAVFGPSSVGGKPTTPAVQDSGAQKRYAKAMTIANQPLPEGSRPQDAAAAATPPGQQYPTQGDYGKMYDLVVSKLMAAGDVEGAYQYSVMLGRAIQQGTMHGLSRAIVAMQSGDMNTAAKIASDTYNRYIKVGGDRAQFQPSKDGKGLLMTRFDEKTGAQLDKAPVVVNVDQLLQMGLVATDLGKYADYMQKNRHQTEIERHNRAIEGIQAAAAAGRGRKERDPLVDEKHRLEIAKLQDEQILRRAQITGDGPQDRKAADVTQFQTDFGSNWGRTGLDDKQKGDAGNFANGLYAYNRDMNGARAADLTGVVMSNDPVQQKRFRITSSGDLMSTLEIDGREYIVPNSALRNAGIGRPQERTYVPGVAGPGAVVPVDRGPPPPPPGTRPQGAPAPGAPASRTPPAPPGAPRVPPIPQRPAERPPGVAEPPPLY